MNPEEFEELLARAIARRDAQWESRLESFSVELHKSLAETEKRLSGRIEAVAKAVGVSAPKARRVRAA